MNSKLENTPLHLVFSAITPFFLLYPHILPSISHCHLDQPLQVPSRLDTLSELFDYLYDLASFLIIHYQIHDCLIHRLTSTLPLCLGGLRVLGGRTLDQSKHCASLNGFVDTQVKS